MDTDDTELLARVADFWAIYGEARGAWKAQAARRSMLESSPFAPPEEPYAYLET